jgi:uncharacterized protein GlcG (DUF336 family)
MISDTPPSDRAWITLAQASIIVDQTLQAARERDLPPLTVTVLDPGGRLVAAKREDNSSFFRAEISSAKAWGALAMGMPTRLLADRAAKAPDFTQSLTVLTQGRFVPVPGGVLIRDGEGRLLGGVGVSGAHPDDDEACATAGVRAAGLVADTEGPPRK